MLSLLLAIAALTAPVTSHAVAPAPPVGTPVVAPAVPPAPVAQPSSDTTYSANYEDEADEQTLYMDPEKMGPAYDNERKDILTQWEFPEYQPPATPEWLKWFAEMFKGSGNFFTVVFYIMVVLIICAILYALFPPFRDLVDRTLGRMRARKEGEDEEDWAPQTSVAVELLAEADKLAAEGRYAEAVHLLLGRSIEDIGRRRPQLLRPALTARDIARSPDLPETAREAFTTIANVVEISHFGRRPVDADGWQQCRDAYSRFALRESWSARADNAATGEAAPA